jgi:hypothetical protein
MHRGLEELLRRFADADLDPRGSPRTRTIIETILAFLSETDPMGAATLMARFMASQLSAFRRGHRPPRSVLLRLARRGRDAELVESLLDALDGLARMPAAVGDDIGSIGRYHLVRKLPCSPPEACFLATAGEDEVRDRFLRTFPKERMNDELLERLRRGMKRSSEGTAQIFDFGVVDHRPYVAAEYVAGIDLRRLKETRPSLPILLALLADGMAALEAIHEGGETHGHLSEGRIRIQPLGGVKLCTGTSELSLKESRGEDLCTLARLMLGVALDDAELFAVLDTNVPEALMVAADRLEELHPELDDLIAAVLWQRRDPDGLLSLAAKHITREQALSFVGVLVEEARA